MLCFKVMFNGIAEYEYDSKSNFSHEWIYLDTFFNGRCKEFVAKQELMAYQYLAFEITSGPVDLYLVQPGKALKNLIRRICPRMPWCPMFAQARSSFWCGRIGASPPCPA